MEGRLSWNSLVTPIAPQSVHSGAAGLVITGPQSAKVAYEASDFGSGSAATAVFRVSGDVARTGHPVQVPIRRQIEGNVRIMLQTTAATAP